MVSSVRFQIQTSLSSVLVAMETATFVPSGEIFLKGR